jgi:hypothetical protein
MVLEKSLCYLSLSAYPLDIEDGRYLQVHDLIYFANSLE